MNTRESVQGDDFDPLGLRSFSVLRGGAIENAANFLAGHPEFYLAPIREGDVDEPEFVDELRFSFNPTHP